VTVMRTIFLSILLTPQVLLSHDIVFSDKKPVFTRLKFGQSTLLRFPERVTTINGADRLNIGPANESAPDYSVLKASPRIRKGSGSVVFILSSGKVVMLSFAVTPAQGQSAPPFVDFIASKKPQTQNLEPKISHVDFMRSMLLQKRIRGFKKSNVSQTIDTGNDDTHMELRKIYQGSKFNGYVYDIKNTNRKKTLVIDVRHLELGKDMDLVCASIRFPFLAPGETTKLWVLAKSNTSPEDMVLPYTKIKVKHG